jgi:hypothetical protein
MKVDVDLLDGLVDEIIEEGSDSDPESVAKWLRVRTKVDAHVTNLVAELDTWGDYTADGAPNAKTWVATTGHLPSGEAGRMVRRGRAKNQIPRCWEAWRNGEITSSHFDVILKLRNPRTQDALDRDEEMLVDQARTLRFEDFVKSSAYWEQMADADGTEESAEEKRTRRDVYLVPSVDGRFQPVSATTSANFSDGVI